MPSLFRRIFRETWSICWPRSRLSHWECQWRGRECSVGRRWHAWSLDRTSAETISECI